MTNLTIFKDSNAVSTGRGRESALSQTLASGGGTYRRIQTSTNGTFKRNAAVETAMVSGSFEGTLKVSGHLDVGPGATVKGTVSYGTITVASGGKLLGTIESA